MIVMNSEWQPSLPEEEVPPYTGFQYDFPVEDVLLGEGTDALFKGLKGPIVSVALALGFAVLVVKYTTGDDIDVILTPKDIIVGMMGFLACKVSVVLAAFKPITVGPEVTE